MYREKSDWEDRTFVRQYLIDITAAPSRWPHDWSKTLNQKVNEELKPYQHKSTKTRVIVPSYPSSAAVSYECLHVTWSGICSPCEIKNKHENANSSHWLHLSRQYQITGNDVSDQATYSKFYWQSLHVRSHVTNNIRSVLEFELIEVTCALRFRLPSVMQWQSSKYP